MLRRLTLFSLALVLAVPKLRAQSLGDSPFGKLLAQHLDSMFQDTLVIRLSRRPSGLQLNEVLREDMLLRLSDSNLVRLAAVTLLSLQKVDSNTCAGFVPGSRDSAAGIISLATRVDSATAKRWIYLMHQMMLTGLRNTPRGRVVSLDTAFAGMRAMLVALPPEEHARIRAAMSSPNGSRADRCRFAQLVFSGFMRMPPDQAGPMMRTLMGLNFAH